MKSNFEFLKNIGRHQHRLAKQLKVAVTTVSGTTQKERAKPSERVSAMMNWTEAQTRYTIWNHRVNVQAGWKNF